MAVPKFSEKEMNERLVNYLENICEEVVLLSVFLATNLKL